MTRLGDYVRLKLRRVCSYFRTKRWLLHRVEELGASNDRLRAFNRADAIDRAHETDIKLSELKVRFDDLVQFLAKSKVVSVTMISGNYQVAFLDLTDVNGKCFLVRPSADLATSPTEVQATV